MILLPTLQMLYQTSGQGAPSQMYMLLIVILMLSQDPTFSQHVHHISLQNTPWYTERLLKDTSLGEQTRIQELKVLLNSTRGKSVSLHFDKAERFGTLTTISFSGS